MALPPVVGVGTMYFRRSPESVMSDRFCSVPSQFGYEACSMMNVMAPSASLSEYLPKWELAPCTAELYSSGVPLQGVDVPA